MALVLYVIPKYCLEKKAFSFWRLKHWILCLSQCICHSVVSVTVMHLSQWCICHTDVSVTVMHLSHCCVCHSVTWPGIDPTTFSVTSTRRIYGDGYLLLNQSWLSRLFQLVSVSELFGWGGGEMIGWVRWATVSDWLEWVAWMSWYSEYWSRPWRCSLHQVRLVPAKIMHQHSSWLDWYRRHRQQPYSC